VADAALTIPVSCLFFSSVMDTDLKGSPLLLETTISSVSFGLNPETGSLSGLFHAHLNMPPGAIDVLAGGLTSV
jgi:hypothetical protein